MLQLNNKYRNRIKYLPNGFFDVFDTSENNYFGGFPLEADKLFNVYYLCKKLEPELENILPTYTFESSKYKNNGKNYCNKLKQYRNFNQMYEYLVGRKFFGDLYQPHPSDIRREAKWRVSTRQ